MPEDVQRLVGLVLSDLRTSLDYLACQLAIRNKRSESGVEFPISRSPEAFKDALSGKIKKIGPSALFEISRIEPYKGGASAGGLTDILYQAE